MRVHVTTGPIPAGNEPVHLLVPLPPDTPEQTYVGLETNLSRSSNNIRARNASQYALVFDVPASGAAEFVFTFTTPQCGCIRQEQFRRVESGYTLPSPELVARVSDLLTDCLADDEKLRALINFTGAIFDYDHPERPFNYGMDRVPLLLTLTKGSCTDIHGFLTSMMYAADMPVAYYAGHFFAEGTNLSPGFHCWCGTLPDGKLTYWDVAQQIKAGSSQSIPGYNPMGGRRFALSCGRGLIFELGDVVAALGHFGSPTWVFADGTTSAYGAKGELLEDFRIGASSVTSTIVAV